MSSYSDYIGNVDNELLREWLTGKTPQGLNSPLRGLMGFAPGIADAFHRVRVSEPLTLFDSVMEFDLGAWQWDTVTNGTATATHVPGKSTASLTVGTANADRIYRQSHRYIPYQPGKSQLVKLTFGFGATKANNTQYVMYGDDNNGVGIGLDNTGIFAFSRNEGVQTTVRQSSWNLDKLDGTGWSGKTLDVTKSQIFVTDIQWLGVGDPVLYFEIDRQLIPFHQFKHANLITDTYMKTARLPVRYEIVNTGVTSGSTTLTQICSEVASEGGRGVGQRQFSTSNGVTLRSVTATPLPLIAIRADLNCPAGGSIVNRKSLIINNLSIYSQDAEIFWQLLFNPTVTGGAWADVDGTNSGAQVNVTGTSVSGGTVIASGYCQGTAVQGGAIQITPDAEIALAVNAAGTVGDILCLVCTRIAATSSDCGGAITWQEF